MKEKVVIVKIIPPIIMDIKVPREVKIEPDKDESAPSTVLSTFVRAPHVHNYATEV